MVLGEGVGWIVVVEVGWHGTTLDDAPADLNHKTHFLLFLIQLG